MPTPAQDWIEMNTGIEHILLQAAPNKYWKNHTMNERIEELAAQCGFRSNHNIYDRNQSFDITKFAELIVRECADLVKDNMDQYNGIALITPAEIKQHFGVEE